VDAALKTGSSTVDEASSSTENSQESPPDEDDGSDEGKASQEDTDDNDDDSKEDADATQETEDSKEDGEDGQDEGESTEAAEGDDSKEDGKQSLKIFKTKFMTPSCICVHCHALLSCSRKYIVGCNCCLTNRMLPQSNPSDRIRIELCN